MAGVPPPVVGQGWLQECPCGANAATLTTFFPKDDPTTGGGTNYAQSAKDWLQAGGDHMKEQIEHTWLKNEDFNAANPLVVRIVSYVRNSKDALLAFELPNKSTRQMSLWGDNKNTLVRELGTETDDWIGKQIRIAQFTNQADGKTIKRIEV